MNRFARLGLIVAVGLLACNDRQSLETKGAEPPPGTAGTGGTSAAGTTGAAGTTDLPSGAVRLIAPLSLSTVTSRHPSLHWALGSAADGARVQICQDRACAKVLTTFDAVGASGVPPDDLPTGVLFWRAWARNGGALAQVPTATWELFVGARSAPVDTSWGSALDVNGDGFADLVVEADVYLGGAKGLAPSPSIELAPLDADYGNGFDLKGPEGSAGDVNGDGYGDFVVRDASAPSGMDAAYVYLGGPAGLPTVPSATLRGHVANFAYSGWVAGAGDVNGDGYADIVVGDTTTGVGLASVYLGGADGPSSTPSTTLMSPDGNDSFGYYVASAGDVNGDGYADIVVEELQTSNTPHPGPFFAFVYLGGPEGPSMKPAVGLAPPTGLAFNEAFVSSAGDFDGDGYADILVGGSGVACLYRGSASGPSSMPGVTFHGLDGSFGASLAAVGDVNRDGYGDIVIANPGIISGGGPPGEPGNIGQVSLYLGGVRGPPSMPSLIVADPDPTAIASNNQFGESTVGVGDVNGDGFADVAALGSARYIFLGGATGLASTPSITLK